LDNEFKNDEFVNSYLNSLKNFTIIEWISNKPDFVRLSNINSIKPKLEFLKGTELGEEVIITCKVSTYPDGSAQNKPLQTKTVSLKLIVVQKPLSPRFYSITNLGGEVGDVFIANSSSQAFIMNGGETFDLLQTYEGSGEIQGLPVYEYVDGIPQQVNEYDGGILKPKYTTKMIDVVINIGTVAEPSYASLIGDTLFTVQKAGTLDPALYFGIDALGNKIYSARPTKAGSIYTLEIFAENIITEVTETIDVIGPFGDIFHYSIKVLSDIIVSSPETNITAMQSLTGSLGVVNLATNQTYEVTKLNETQNLALPISFEIDSLSNDINFATITEETEDKFDVGINGGTYLKGHSIYISDSEGNITQESLYTNLQPHLVASNKNVSVKCITMFQRLTHQASLRLIMLLVPTFLCLKNVKTK
jgi:hypothetical protein